MSPGTAAAIARLRTAAAAGAVAGVVARTLPARTQAQVIVACGAPYLLAAGVLCARRPAPAVAAVVLAGAAVRAPRATGSTGSGVPSAGSTAPTGPTVMTTNALIGRADPGRVLAAARDASVDVLFVPEFTAPFAATFDAAGALTEFPHRVLQPRDGGGGTALFSRHPLTQARVHPGFVCATLSAQVQLPAGPTRVVAVHPIPPWPFPLADHLSDFRLLRAMLTEFRSDPRVVVGGDFNATSDHRHFRELVADGFVDAARADGRIARPTWPAVRWAPPLLCLDHVLVRGLAVAGVRTIRLPGTDHLAVVARLGS